MKVIFPFWNGLSRPGYYNEKNFHFESLASSGF